KAVWRFRRHVLHGMDGEIELASQQRFLDLLRKKSLPAGFHERTVLNAVPRRLEGQYLDGSLIEAVRGDQPLLHLIGLGERQRRSAATYPDLASLHAPISGC